MALPASDFGVYRTKGGAFDYCPQDFLLRGDTVVARNLTPAKAEEMAERLNGGAETDPIVAIGAESGGVRWLPVLGRIG